MLEQTVAIILSSIEKAYAHDQEKTQAEILQAVFWCVIATFGSLGSAKHSQLGW